MGDEETRFFRVLYETIWKLSEESIKPSAILISSLFDANFPYSFNIFICQLIFSSFVSLKKDINIYLSLLQEINTLDIEVKNSQNIIFIMAQYLKKIATFESNYMLEMMIETNLIDANMIKSMKSLYFAHYITKEEVENLKYLPFWKTFFANINDLSKDNWELHKQLIKEGVNPDETAKIIRNDEIEKLQEISSQQSFNFNQKISPSLYERCSFINKENVTLIDYAAFFGSVKCFKYLLMNNAKVENTGKYAIAGGNIEIIHLCEQNHSSFKNAYEAAIEFHRNDIFKYIYENKLDKIEKLEELGTKCILYNNYETFFI